MYTVEILSYISNPLWKCAKTKGKLRFRFRASLALVKENQYYLSSVFHDFYDHDQNKPFTTNDYNLRRADLKNVQCRCFNFFISFLSSEHCQKCVVQIGYISAFHKATINKQSFSILITMNVLRYTDFFHWLSISFNPYSKW